MLVAITVAIRSGVTVGSGVLVGVEVRVGGGGSVRAGAGVKDGIPTAIGADAVAVTAVVCDEVTHAVKNSELALVPRRRM